MSELLDALQLQREREGRRIYHALFGRAIPPLLLERYLAAARRLDGHVDAQALAAYYQAVGDSKDLEALEFAGRLTGRLPLLSRKFQAMVYLAETLPENQDFYVNRRTSFQAGMLAIAAAAFRSAFKTLTGLIALRQVKNA